MNLIGTQPQTEVLIEILYFRNSSKPGDQSNYSTWTVGKSEIQKQSNSQYQRETANNQKGKAKLKVQTKESKVENR